MSSSLSIFWIFCWYSVSTWASWVGACFGVAFFFEAAAAGFTAVFAAFLDSFGDGVAGA